MKSLTFEYNKAEYNMVIGRNKEGNFNIIDDSDDLDIWFHIEDEPSCHLILKNTEKMKLNKIPRQVIKFCAYQCKIHSKAKRLPKCNVIYTLLSNVIKTEIVGKVAVREFKTVTV
jgi:predicted ribosome quality control (RQC) complex YloA/Tae2 family protein